MEILRDVIARILFLVGRGCCHMSTYTVWICSRNYHTVNEQFLHLLVTVKLFKFNYTNLIRNC